MDKYPLRIWVNTSVTCHCPSNILLVSCAHLTHMSSPLTKEIVEETNIHGIIQFEESIFLFSNFRGKALAKYYNFVTILYRFVNVGDSLAPII